jgi:hypothetical protein
VSHSLIVRRELDVGCGDVLLQTVCVATEARLGFAMVQVDEEGNAADWAISVSKDEYGGARSIA